MQQLESGTPVGKPWAKPWLKTWLGILRMVMLVVLFIASMLPLSADKCGMPEWGSSAVGCGLVAWVILLGATLCRLLHFLKDQRHVAILDAACLVVVAILVLTAMSLSAHTAPHYKRLLDNKAYFKREAARYGAEMCNSDNVYGSYVCAALFFAAVLVMSVVSAVFILLEYCRMPAVLTTTYVQPVVVVGGQPGAPTAGASGTGPPGEAGAQPGPAATEPPAQQPAEVGAQPGAEAGAQPGAEPALPQAPEAPLAPPEPTKPTAEDPKSLTKEREPSTKEDAPPPKPRKARKSKTPKSRKAPKHKEASQKTQSQGPDAAGDLTAEDTTHTAGDESRDTSHTH